MPCWLEVEPQCDLNDARGPVTQPSSRTQNLAKCRAQDIGVRVGEFGVIKEIEKIPTQFHLDAIAEERSCFGNREIEVCKTWTSQEIARQSAIGGKFWIRGDLGVRGQDARPGRAGALIVGVAALRIAEARGIKEEVPGLPIEALSYFGIESSYRPDEIAVSEKTVSRARCTFGTSIEAIG